MDGSEIRYLESFDVKREEIRLVAEKIYSRGPKGSDAYFLVAEDF